MKIIDNSKISQKFTSNIEDQVRCSYHNLSSNWQIIKITDMPNYYWEKVVFPGEKISFKGSIKANLKIFSAKNITAILIDTIPCQKLKTN